MRQRRTREREHRDLNRDIGRVQPPTMRSSVPFAGANATLTGADVALSPASALPVVSG
ncbi:MAG: hypothetical protein M5U01_15585 [Ardenticatenaceae bacterium]|nr:hypothetical protein [Ardenticatenaceae bacterium]